MKQTAIEYLELQPIDARTPIHERDYQRSISNLYTIEIEGIIDLYAHVSAWGIGSNFLQTCIDNDDIDKILNHYRRRIVQLIKTDQDRCYKSIVLVFDIAANCKLVGVAEQDGYGLKVIPFEVQP